jgi:hypothetical protein
MTWPIGAAYKVAIYQKNGAEITFRSDDQGHLSVTIDTANLHMRSITGTKEEH